MTEHLSANGPAMEPANLSVLIKRSPLDAIKSAIVAKLEPLLVGVNVKSHPGKLDISDVMAKAVVSAPGLAIGWNRIRYTRMPSNEYVSVVSWLAYIVVEDYADVTNKRRVSRETVAHAIGDQLLEILHSVNESQWVAGMGMVETDPAPELKPVFTLNAYAEGAAYYALSWDQHLPRRGDPIGAPLDPETGSGLPPEIAAILRAAEPEAAS
ncbi:MAG: hypothetical protein AAF141_10995 [Pseudomonadota bacterium]